MNILYPFLSSYQCCFIWPLNHVCLQPVLLHPLLHQRQKVSSASEILSYSGALSHLYSWLLIWRFLFPNQMKGGALSFRRWVRGRSLYCSKLLTSRAKSRYLFLTYLVTLHLVVLLCLTGVLWIHCIFWVNYFSIGNGVPIQDNRLFTCCC